MNGQLSNEVIIELKNPACDDFARDVADREWVQDYQAQQRDLQTSWMLGAGILLGILSWAVIATLVFFLTGCTATVSIQPLNFEAVDGGSEPLGYGMTQDLEIEESDETK